MKNLKKCILILGLTGILGISGCGNSAMSEKYDTADTAGVTSNYSMMESDADVAEAKSVEDGLTDQIQGQKLIITENLTVETADFDSFLKTVNEKVTALGGYIENSEISGTLEYENRYANFCLRIPAEKLSEFVASVDENATVTYDSKSTEDVTLNYVDTESHLKALKTEEETLLSLLEKAEKLSDVFEIQQELTEVRYQIESYASQLRVYDNLVDYSTVNLTVHEVTREREVEKSGFWSEAGADFKNNLYGVGWALRGFAIWLIGSLPVLLILAVIIGGIVWGMKKHRKKKRLKKSADAEPENAESKEKHE